MWKDPRVLPWDMCEYLEQRLLPAISEGRLPTLMESYGKPCWFISLDVALKQESGSDYVHGDGGGKGTDDLAVPHFPQFSQEFSPIAYAAGFNHVVYDDNDFVRDYSSSSDVPED